MITIKDSLGDRIVFFHYCESREDLRKAYNFARANQVLGLDTEGTGLNPYHPNWRLRTFQIGDSTNAYIIPAKFKSAIERILLLPIRWIGHNGPHDIRCLDVHLGYETGVVCKGETYFPAHYRDSRNAAEGGVGHGLKEQGIKYVGWDAGKWEVALKKKFKEIKIEIPGEVYKSGPRKGTQKYRNAKISEGWSLIDPRDPAFIAYAGADPIITFCLWYNEKNTVREFIDLYRFDHKVQLACDRLQRRAIKLDVYYTNYYRHALSKKTALYQRLASRMGCGNVYSGAQVAKALSEAGATFTEYTKTGKIKTDNATLRQFLSSEKSNIVKLVRIIIIAKQLDKRRAAYAENMLNERDINDRIHPSINSIGARTARMSVSSPALQQLPTREGQE